MVVFGALFPLCMREDHLLNVQQMQALYPRPKKGGKGLGCCEVPRFNVAGTATEVRRCFAPLETSMNFPMATIFVNSKSRFKNNISRKAW